MGYKKLDKDDLRESFLKYIRAGVPINKACDGVGIDESTFYAYYNKGELDFKSELDTNESKFFKLLKNAKADFIDTHLKNIAASATKDWKASAWLLERIYPEYYALKQNLNVETDKITIVSNIPSKEELASSVEEGMKEEAENLSANN